MNPNFNIFVSHVISKDTGSKDTWVSDFAGYLSKLLQTLTTTQIRMINVEETAEKDADIGDANAFVVILTPEYFTNPASRKEFESILKKLGIRHWMKFPMWLKN